VSDYAATMAPSKLDLRPGQTIRLEDAILALCTKSANDVAVVLAEGLGGNEENFAHIMTQTAAKLGMTRTHFANASGLPDNDQLTTARDMATLGLALIRDFPQFYPYFNTRTFAYKGEVITNHNHLLGAVDGVDGIKTGFIRAAGFNLVASAKRDGHRIVAVVLGGTTPGLRDKQMTHLLDEGFAEIEMRSDNPVVANAETPQNASHFRPTSYHSAPPMADLSVAADATAQSAQGDSESDADRAAAVRSPSTVQVASNDIMMPPATAGWSIQVGAFASDQAARAAAVKAERQAHRWLQSGKIQIGLSAGSTSAVFRARISGLDQKQAAAACHVLLSQGTRCLALPDQL
jgi:D-alanyl-D-alanine carboxypeptidase